jgi:23S rRNA pseudouridine1911/1915/1917 synthase
MPGTEWRVGSGEAGARLDRYLADPERLGSRRRASQALERGQAFLNGQPATAADAGTRVAEGDEVRVWLDRPGSARTRTGTARVGALEIVYEDAALVVVNKPPGLLTVPLARSGLPSVQTLLAERAARGGRPLPVHRIDRDTSGVVLFAKTRRAQHALKDQFERREPERIYMAIVEGHPSPPIGTWRDYLAWDAAGLEQVVVPAAERYAAEALTHYRVVERIEDTSALEIRLETGKRNQIRVQAAAHGHPLLGERQYRSAAAPPRVAFSRQALHAARLTLRHPVDGRMIRFEAPLAADLQTLLQALRRR